MAACPGPSPSGVSASRTGALKLVTVWVFGSKIGMTSVEYSGEPKTGPWALTVGYRRSEAIRSCKYFFGSPQSHVVTTTLRSSHCGRVGLFLGNSPLATRCVQSAKYLIGAPASWPAMILTISAPDCPAWMRRVQASAWFENSPSPDGKVRVDCWPSWWQPTQPLFFI